MKKIVRPVARVSEPMSMLEKVEGKKRRTEKVRAAIGDKMGQNRIKQAVVLTGVSAPKPTLITRDMFNMLDIDQRYQRDRISDHVRDLISAIRAGGIVPDPVTLCRRKYAEGGEVSKKLWIIDGQQRTYAFFEMDTPFWANIYEVDSLDAERQFFIVMNTRRIVGAAYTIHSWAGPSADLLRAVDSNPDHPMYGQVCFKTGANRRFSAASLVRAMLSAATGTQSATGGVTDTLQRADAALGAPDAKKRAAMILRVIPEVFPRVRPKTLPLVAIGRVAFRRWERDKDVYIPSAQTVSWLKRKNWDNIAPSVNSKFLPLLESEVERSWR